MINIIRRITGLSYPSYHPSSSSQLRHHESPPSHRKSPVTVAAKFNFKREKCLIVDRNADRRNLHTVLLIAFEWVDAFGIE